MKDRSFTGRLALVTGATSGIGRAIALELAENGADVALVARRDQLLADVAARIEAKGGKAYCYPVDLGSDGQIEQLGQAIRSSHEYLEVLVHSAGIISLGPIDEVPVADFDAQYQVNVKGPFLLTKLLLPMLVAARGQVVFINSTAGRIARGGVSQYAATKHALRAVADSLREEINTDGVRVLSVFLGRTATPMQEMIHEVEGRAYRPEKLIQPRDVATMVRQTLELPRTVEVTDVYLRPMNKS